MSRVLLLIGIFGAVGAALALRTLWDFGGIGSVFFGALVGVGGSAATAVYVAFKDLREEKISDAELKILKTLIVKSDTERKE